MPVLKILAVDKVPTVSSDPVDPMAREQAKVGHPYQDLKMREYLYCLYLLFLSSSYFPRRLMVFTYLQSMDFQRESQSKHHLYCKQEKPAHCHGSLLLRLGTHQIQNRTRDAHKISPHGTMTKRTPAMN